MGSCVRQLDVEKRVAGCVQLLFLCSHFVACHPD